MNWRQLRTDASIRIFASYLPRMLPVAMALTPTDAELSEVILEIVDADKGEMKITFTLEDGQAVILALDVEASMKSEGAYCTLKYA